MILVSKSKAMLVYRGQAHKVLLGVNTPLGVFDLHKRIVVSPGYEGQVLAFHETPDFIYAIHRVWKNLSIRRKLIRSDDPRDRIMTQGCINVSDYLYDALATSTDKLKIALDF